MLFLTHLLDRPGSDRRQRTIEPDPTPRLEHLSKTLATDH